jgi:hypothetical protein
MDYYSNLGKALIAEVTGTTYLDEEVSNFQKYYYTILPAGVSDMCFGRASSCPQGVGAMNDFQTDPGTIESGTHQDTWISNNVREVFKEERVTGKSRLTQIWQFGGVPAGQHELLVEGYRPDNTEGDNFQFSVSTDGQNFTEVVGAVINSATETTNIYPITGIPESTLIYVKMEDTNRTWGHILDEVYVDHLAIRTQP